MALECGGTMWIHVEQTGAATIIRPVIERLDVEVAAIFRAQLLALIDQGRRHLVVDLHHVLFIDSSGLGALVSALKTIKRSTSVGDVRLARAQAPVVSLIEVIRLNRVFSTYPDVDSAVQSFAACGVVLTPGASQSDRAPAGL